MNIGSRKTDRWMVIVVLAVVLGGVAVLHPVVYWLPAWFPDEGWAVGIRRIDQWDGTAAVRLHPFNLVTAAVYCGLLGWACAANAVTKD